jgi:hypothetical protein
LKEVINLLAGLTAAGLTPGTSPANPERITNGQTKEKEIEGKISEEDEKLLDLGCHGRSSLVGRHVCIDGF